MHTRFSPGTRILVPLVASLLLGFSACDRGEQPPTTNQAVPAVPAAPVTSAEVSTTPTTTPAQAGSRGSQVEITNPEINFGVRKPGSKIEHEFTMRNPTAAPVTISVFKPTCECTSGDGVQGSVVPPGGSIQIPISFQLPNTTGTKRAAVNMVLSNGQALRLALSAESSYAVRTVPIYIDAFTNPADITGVVQLQSVDGRPFSVLSVNGNAPVMATPGGQAPQQNQQIRYDLTTYECSQMPKWLLIETDHPDAALLDMRIRHECTKLQHQVDPNYRPQINFDGWITNTGLIPVGGSGTFNVGVKNPPMRDGRGGIVYGKMPINSVISTSPDFKAELIGQRADDEKRLLVTARITPLTNKTGVFQVPVRFISGNRAQDLLVVGTVR
ncbi:MAG: DUF1573 domain-containing protein [Phycisphaerales bacterium]|nr:DUF1573 domain-containing protein [Phycisphaerales bacterium]